MDPRFAQYQNFAAQQLTPSTLPTEQDVPLTSAFDPRLAGGQAVAQRQLQTQGLWAQNMSTPQQGEMSLPDAGGGPIMSAAPMSQEPVMSQAPAQSSLYQPTGTNGAATLDAAGPPNVVHNVTGMGAETGAKILAQEQANGFGAEAPIPKDYPLSWKGNQAPAGTGVDISKLMADAQNNPELAAHNAEIKRLQDENLGIQANANENKQYMNQDQLVLADQKAEAQQRKAETFAMFKESATELQRDWTTKRQALETEIKAGPKVDIGLQTMALAATALAGIADIANIRGGGEAKYAKSLTDNVNAYVEKQKQDWYAKKQDERNAQDNLFGMAKKVGMSDEEAQLAAHDAALDKIEGQIKIANAQSASSQEAAMRDQTLNLARQAQEKDLKSAVERRLTNDFQMKLAAAKAKAVGAGGVGKNGVLVNPHEIEQLKNRGDDETKYQYVPWKNENGKTEYAAFPSNLANDQAKLVQGLNHITTVKGELQAEIKRLGGMNGMGEQAWNRWIAKNDGTLKSLEKEAQLAIHSANTGVGAMDKGTLGIFESMTTGGWRDNPSKMLDTLGKYTERQKAAASSIIDHFSEPRKLITGATRDEKGNIREEGPTHHIETRRPNSGDHYYQATDSVSTVPDSRMPEKKPEPEPEKEKKKVQLPSEADVPRPFSWFGK